MMCMQNSFLGPVHGSRGVKFNTGLRRGEQCDCLHVARLGCNRRTSSVKYLICQIVMSRTTAILILAKRIWLVHVCVAASQRVSIFLFKESHRSVAHMIQKLTLKALPAHHTYLLSINLHQAGKGADVLSLM